DARFGGEMNQPLAKFAVLETEPGEILHCTSSGALKCATLFLLWRGSGLLVECAPLPADDLKVNFLVDLQLFHQLPSERNKLCVGPLSQTVQVHHVVF